MFQEKLCEFCGEPFVPGSNRQRYCKRPHYMTCPICGKRYLVTNNECLKRPPVACSYECRAKKTRQTSLERYGILAPGNNPEAREKSRQTLQRKYGVDSAMQSDQVKQKAKQAMQEKYGVDNAMQNEEIKKKVAETNMKRYGSKTYLTSEEGLQTINEIMQDRYGTTHPLQNPDIMERFNETCKERFGANTFAGSSIGQKIIRDVVKKRYGVESVTQLESVKQKAKQTWIKKYGVDNPSKNADILQKIKDTMINRYGTPGVLSIPEFREKIMKTSMERYGVPFYVMKDEVKQSSGAISKFNLFIRQKLADRGMPVELEYRIGHFSYDLYLPTKHMLVELNPTYTHNLIGNHWTNTGLKLNYHLDKCKIAHQNGYTQRTLFDWDNIAGFLDEVSRPQLTINWNELHTYVLNREVGIAFLSQYGRSRSTQYPRKSMFIGLTDGNTVYQAIAVGFNYHNDNHPYRILDYGTIWGAEPGTPYDTLFSVLNEFIDISEIVFRIDSDCLHIEDIDALHLADIQYESPRMFWSKGKNRIPCTNRDIRNEEKLRTGWLPIEDCGQIVATIK